MFRCAYFLLLIISFAGNTLCHAEMYKWVDDQGRTHYSESPPPAQYDALDIQGELVEISSEIPDIEFYEPPQHIRVKPLPKLRKGEVWMFTTPSCGYCDRAKDYFRLNKVRYRELDITTNDQYRAWFKRFGGRGVPLTVVGGVGAPQTIAGFAEARFDQVFDNR